MKRRVVAIALIVLSMSSFARDFTPRDLLRNKYTFEQVKDALVMNQKWVPYPAYSDRAGWDKLMGEYKSDIIRDGEKYLDYEWRVVKATDYMAFEQDGNRRVMEVPLTANNQAIASLFAAELAEGKGRFIPQIINGMFHTCEMTSWSLSAHLSSLSPSRRSLPEKGDNTLELTQGNMSQMFSWIMYFLRDEFDRIQPELSRRFAAEIKYRELDSYLEREDLWWMGLGENYNNRMLNNWTPWCSSNALLSFMLMENDRDRLAQAVWKSIQSVDQYLNYVQGDGGIEEGPSYWGHAPGKLYDYLNALSMITGGKVSIFDEKQVRDMGEYIARSYVGDGWVVNFADASARGGGLGDLIYRYGKAVHSDLMMGYATMLRDRNGVEHLSAGVDISRFLEDLSYSEEYRNSDCKYAVSDYTWYPETEFHYMSNSDGVFVAARGGYNNESHNHNDVGSFNLYYDNLPVLIDVGVGTYTRQTFSSERYSIWTMQSLYHNIPEINGFAQKHGGRYRASECMSKPGSFSANIAEAYPEEAKVKKWIRSYALDGKTVKLTDKFTLEEALVPNILHFMTWGNVDAGVPGIITVKIKGRTMEIRYDKSQFTAAVEPIELTDRALSNVWGEKIFRISLTAGKLQTSGTYSITITKKDAGYSFINDNIKFADAQMCVALKGVDAFEKENGSVKTPFTIGKDGNVKYVNETHWVGGFFPGSLWYMYELTGNERYAREARKLTESISGVQYITNNHDVGFICMCSFGNGMRLKGLDYKSIIVQTAESLCSRWREAPGLIQSWEPDEKRDRKCPVIIDNMMNLELLFRASELTGDDKYRQTAIKHADKTLKEHFRPDGSTWHVVDYDPVTGAVRKKVTAQGYSDESVWSRGQAWAIYGYTMCYRFTGDKKYIEQAIRTFNMMKNHPNMPADCVPWWDMCAPDIPNTCRDASSAAIIASALYEMSTMDVENPARYREYADRIMTSLSGPAYRAETGANGGFLLMHSVGSIPHNAEVDKPLNYADYYFLEALKRKRDIL